MNRKKYEALKWIDKNYFVAIYDEEDNYMTSFETIEETAKFFNITNQEVLRRCRKNSSFKYMLDNFIMYLVNKRG